MSGVPPTAGQQELQAAWRRVTRRLAVGLVLAFLLSALAGWIWLGDDWFTGTTSTAAAVTGAVIAGLAVALVAASLVYLFRSPEPRLREHFLPGKLGLARFAAVVLAAFALGPAYLALTLVLDR